MIPLYATGIVLLAVLASLSPDLARVLVYDRQAILEGEWWRLFSGHLVHFSHRHLFYDVLAFGLAGWLIEQRRYPGHKLLYPVLALAIGATLLIVEPAMDYYGGLSGMACGTIVFAALYGMRESRPWQLACAGTLLVLGGKLFAEILGHPFELGITAADGLQPVPSSHVAGALSAAAVYTAMRAGSRARLPRQSATLC